MHSNCELLYVRIAGCYTLHSLRSPASCSATKNFNIVVASTLNATKIKDETLHIVYFSVQNRINCRCACGQAMTVRIPLRSSLLCTIGVLTLMLTLTYRCLLSAYVRFICRRTEASKGENTTAFVSFKYESKHSPSSSLSAND